MCLSVTITPTIRSTLPCSRTPKSWTFGRYTKATCGATTWMATPLPRHYRAAHPGPYGRGCVTRGGDRRRHVRAHPSLVARRYDPGNGSDRVETRGPRHQPTKGRRHCRLDYPRSWQSVSEPTQRVNLLGTSEGTVSSRQCGWRARARPGSRAWPCRTSACRRPLPAFAPASLRLPAAPEAWRSALN